MKKILIFILTVGFLAMIGGAGFTAINKAPFAIKGISTVDAVKKISFPYAPLLVPPDNSASAQQESSASPEVSAKYKTGTGVILSTTNLLDGETHSSLTLLNSIVSLATMRQMQNETAPYATIQVSPPKQNYATLFGAMFEKMPSDLHTYILTLKLESTSNIRPFLNLRVNSLNFSGEQLMVNNATNEIRVLFMYSAANNRINVSGFLERLNNLNSDITLKIHYIQLVQID